MAQGNIKANKWAIVLNGKKDTQEQDLKAELLGALDSIKNDSTIKYIFSIIHDKDFNDNGEPKRTHLHIVIEYLQKRTFAAVLETLQTKTNFDKEQISLEQTNSEMLAEQYLIHKNDTTKFSYNAELIITNDRKELDRRLALEYLTPTEREERNKQALLTAHNMTEFFNMVGVDFANKNRGLFKDLLAERHEDIDYIYDRVNRLEHFIKDIKPLLIDLLPNVQISKFNKDNVYSKLIEFYLDQIEDLI